ncbi:MAG: helix-turn-helix domain-containing protein [Acidimicrobiales bacterium]
MKGATMANYSRWDDIKKHRPAPSADARDGVENDLALGQLIYDLRTEAGFSQCGLAERIGTTQSVISRLEEGGSARNRIDTLARVARALGRHLVVSFPGKVPAKLRTLSRSPDQRRVNGFVNTPHTYQHPRAPTRWSGQALESAPDLR